MKKIISSFLFSSVCIVNVSFAQVSVNLVDSFQTCINNHIANTPDIGISAAVIMPNGGIWVGAAGDDGMSLPIQTTTPFYAASTSKTFISACFLQLAEAGTISLNNPIHSFLRSNKYPSAYIDSTITLNQLLNHTSGIFNYGDNPTYMNTMIANPTKVYHHGEALTLFLNQPPYFAKGTSFHYSNSNYTLLAMILEKITNMDLKDVIYNRILQPLHLTTTFSSDSTTPNSTAGFWANTGTGGDLNLSGLSHTGLLTSSWGPGHMVTTPFDLAHYCRALIKGQLYTNPSTINTMLTIDTLSTAPSSYYGYGLGIERKKYAGNYLYGHTGNIGHITYMFHSPSGDYTIVTMTNRFAVNGSDNVLAFRALEKIILRHLNYPLDITEKNNSVSFDVFPNPTQNHLTVRVPKTGNSLISITNVVGKEIIQQQLSEMQQDVDVSALQSGVYFVKLTQDGISSSKRIVVNR